jgi:hypothetical protein
MSTSASISSGAANGSISGVPPMGAANWAARSDREHLLDRLHNLRTIVPVLATELANARRQAAHLGVENRKLTEQLRRAQANGGARAPVSVQRVLSAKLTRDGRAGASRPSTRPR